MLGLALAGEMEDEITPLCFKGIFPKGPTACKASEKTLANLLVPAAAQKACPGSLQIPKSAKKLHSGAHPKAWMPGYRPWAAWARLGAHTVISDRQRFLRNCIPSGTLAIKKPLFPVGQGLFPT
jgi:hypothetical protein